MNALAATTQVSPAPAQATPQLRTLLLTDLVDSTGTVERLGDAPSAELFRAHDRLVLELQQRWRGRLIDRSDGLLLLFERAVDGLGFALDYNRGLRELGKAHGVPLQARAGLHVGEVLTWRNSDEAVAVGAKPLEVEGLAKPLAGRLLGLARPGQILLSATAEALAHRAARELGERGTQLAWKSHGRWRFKGLPEPLEVYETGEPGLAPLQSPRPDAKAWRDIPFWRRPAALAAELALAAVVAIGIWFFTRPQPAIAFAERDWVVVADMRNLTGQPVLDESLQQAFRISLEQSRHVNVLSDLKARDTLARMQRQPGTALDREIASEIAVRDGARAVILPTVAEVGGRVRVSAEVIDPQSQTTVYAEYADGSGLDSVLASVDAVTAALRARLGEEIKAIERDSEPLPQVSTSNLDALRAYALGREAFGMRRYEKSQRLFARAIELDPEFALAHLGALGAANALMQRELGTAHLERALALKERLPPRDRMYAEAWEAEFHAPSNAAEKWRDVAQLYPDYYGAQANTAYWLFNENRFEEALPFALASTSRFSLTAPLSWELVGRIYLARERYESALEAMRKAGDENAFPTIRLADAYAASGRLDHAEQVLAKFESNLSMDFNRISIRLDQGKWSGAYQELVRLKGAPRNQSSANQFLLAPTEILLLSLADEGYRAKVLLVHTSKEVLRTILGGDSVDLERDAYLALTLALMAQAMDENETAQALIDGVENLEPAQGLKSVDGLRAVVKANALRVDGKPQQALRHLAAQLDGAERLEAYHVLVQIYADLGDVKRMLQAANTLSSRRGMAYMQMGCGWCQQPELVLRTKLIHLQLSEALASRGKPQLAKRELKAFDAAFSEELPRQLRRRRVAVEATFN